MSDLIQFQPAIQPGVEIEQQVTAAAASPTPTAALPAVIIGILNKTVDYVYCDAYTKTPLNSTYLFSGYELAGRIYANSVGIQARNIEYLIGSSEKPTTATRTGNAILGEQVTPANGNIITDTSAEFTGTASVGDIIEVDHSSFAAPVEVEITAINSDTEIEVDVDFTADPYDLSFAVALTYRQVTVGTASVVDINELQDISVGTDFNDGVMVNDEIIITHASIGTVISRVVSVDSAIQLTTLISLPSSLIGEDVTYRIKRASGEILSSNTDVLEDVGVSNAFSIVEPGDSVAFVHPTLGSISAFVVEVIGSTQIKIDKALPATTNMAYTITRENSAVLNILNNKVGSFVLPTGETSTNVLTNTTSEVNFGSVEVGDTVKIVRGTSIVSATVVSIPDITRIQLSKSFAGGSVFYSVKRITSANAPVTLQQGVHYTLGDSDVDGFVDDPAFTLLGNLTLNSLVVSSADIFNQYRFHSRKDANVILEVDTDTVVQLTGGYNPEHNPLGTGTFLAKVNTGTKVYAIPVGEDSAEGWAEALAVAENMDLYNVALMTQNPTYQSYLRTHVDSMSTAFNHNWRVGWANLPHPYEGITTTKRAGGTLTFFSGVPDYLTLFDPLSNFSGARVGGYVEIRFSYSGTDYVKYLQIAEKINNTTLKLTAKEFNPPTGVPARKGVYLEGAEITSTNGFDDNPDISFPIQVEYEVFYTLSISEQALTIANIAYGFAKRRINYITNETCVLNYDGENNEYPGYYICAAYAGASSGTAPHQPLTYYPLAGIVGVRKGQDWFKDRDQQGIIVKGGGWLVVSRVIDDSLPFAWKQTTTDTTSVKTIEFSFTKNFDEITKAIYNALGIYPGRNNRVPAALAAANATTIANLEVRTTNDTNSATGGFLGPQILSYSFSGHTEDELIADVTYATIDLVLPITWNRLKVTMRA